MLQGVFMGQFRSWVWAEQSLSRTGMSIWPLQGNDRISEDGEVRAGADILPRVIGYLRGAEVIARCHTGCKVTAGRKSHHPDAAAIKAPVGRMGTHITYGTKTVQQRSRKAVFLHTIFHNKGGYALLIQPAGDTVALQFNRSEERRVGKRVDVGRVRD